MGAPFYLVDSIDSLGIEGIGPETVNGIGGEGDNPALFEDGDSEFDLLFQTELLYHFEWSVATLLS